MIMKEGKMVDTGFTASPRQRNTLEESEMIRAGMDGHLWNDHPHKDIDARWMKKNGETYYGYKDHVRPEERPKAGLQTNIR